MKKTSKKAPVRLSEQPGRHIVMRARYDTAQTTEENRRHFSAADHLSADAANHVGVRTILRNRCRYVYANNPRLRGMVRTLANHTVGVGPRLQMQLGDGVQSRKLSDRLEVDFEEWAKAINLARKLRIIRRSRVISGEVFAILGINPALTTRVKLDIRLVEADRVTNPEYAYLREDCDGIFFDDFENPVAYRVLKTHPGDLFRAFGPDSYDDLPAQLVRHYFDQDRPEQHRGIPDITPCVQLVEEGRRFRAAVLGAAETAADFAMAIQTDAGPDGTAVAADPMDEFELKRRMATVLPAGWKLTQTQAEQPTTTFKEFTRELLAEAARCLEMPVSLATLDAADANMSSSYVINQPYENAIMVDRGDFESIVLDPLLDAWLTLSFDPTNGTALSKRVPNEFPHNWYWPLIGEHADPYKVANGQETRLKNNTTTLRREYAREGLDWETEIRQRAKEKALLRELGLTEVEAAPARATVPPGKPNGASKDEDDEEAL
jgi:capsid protein